MSRWRLKKTLARRIEVRPIENEDVRFAWAAYKSGNLEPMGLPKELSAEQFKQAFEAAVLSEFHAAWTIIAETRRGFMPVGFVFGAWAPRQAFMVIIGIVWFSWASKRNIIEGTVAFFNRLRKEMPWMGFATNEHKRLYEVACMHGIMKRIGTSHTIAKDGPMAVFEGRA